MNGYPIIKIQIDGIRSSVLKAFDASNLEINAYVLRSLDNMLQEEWVIAEIDEAVKSCLKQAIKGIAGNYQMKQAIEDVLCETILKKIDRE
jgi:hypothetical protein